MSAIDLPATWPGRHATAAVSVQDGRVSLAAGAGELQAPFALASVTKVLASLAVLVEVDAGRCALSDPAGPPGSTLAHLLSHASGLPLDGTTPVHRPGERRIYSNTGIELAVAHAAARAQVSVAALIAARVVRPLGMDHTSVEGSPACSGVSTVEDACVLAGELLNPTLLASSTGRAQRSVCFEGLHGVLPGFGAQDPCDFGLGVEVKGSKHPHWTGSRWPATSFGHFGRAGGFVVVDVDAGIAVVTLGDEQFGPWATAAWPTFTDAVHEELARAR